jgi:AraC-like DNA-binding protein
MPTLKSVQPCLQLRPFVRAYAQRKVPLQDPIIVESVPAQLEQVLNFELGVLPGVHHREGDCSDEAWIGGAQTSFPGYISLVPGVESFAIFFQPTGWSQLFGVPICEVTNHICDASAISGHCMRELWNRLGESTSFNQRVWIVEQFLLRHLARPVPRDDVLTKAIILFHQNGTASIHDLARQASVGLRQFERQFRQVTGVSPKTFARVARFQAALDAKPSSPKRTWLDIAHSFGYYDQMHMIHDFLALGLNTPTQLVAKLGDVPSPALTSAEM